MLLCVCPVIDHGWRQNVVRRGRRGNSRVRYWCPYRILTSSVIYCWTDVWNLFVLYNKDTKQKHCFMTSSMRLSPNSSFAPRDTPAGNIGSCIHQNKYPVQDDECNYHDSLQAHIIDGIITKNRSKCKKYLTDIKWCSLVVWLVTLKVIFVAQPGFSCSD